MVLIFLGIFIVLPFQVCSFSRWLLWIHR